MFTGKTCFLFFLLLHRLTRGLPTAFQVDPDKFFLFTERGASVHGPSSDNSLSFPPNVWALADTKGSLLEPCQAFQYSLSRKQGTCLIQTSSPTKERWKAWSEQYGASRYIMACMSLDELAVLGLVQITHSLFNDADL